MSVVTLQIGQCGNQVGGQLFAGLMEDVHAKLSQVSWFRFERFQLFSYIYLSIFQ